MPSSMKKKSPELHGTGVALVTPFKKNGAVDFNALERLTNDLIAGGCNYLVPLGTTGETATLTNDEKRDVLHCVVKTGKGRKPIVLGLGGNNTAELVAQLEHNTFDGVDALLSVSPYYNKPSQRGIIAHYTALSKASPLPIILYNVPGRTGSNIHASTTLQLANEVPGIVGIKEASGKVEQILEILAGAPKGFRVISGDDGITLPLIAAGACGVISVVANAFPKQTSEMVNKCLAGDFAKARVLHNLLLPIIPALFEEGSPSGIKHILSRMGRMENTVRLPAVPVSSSHSRRLDALFAPLIKSSR
jgi:4-hydroxy-tetrahydrodipicolinate synthase